MLIIDECHEGVDTDRTDAALDVIKRKAALYLSGTPFKALANKKFDTDAIYNWTYLDEQQAKQAELAQGETGDHVNLPDLRLFTYRISQMTADAVNHGVEIDDQTYDYAFDLNEFFAVNSRNQLIHEDDVRAFLRNLTTNEKYPFSTPELRNELKHTFWYVGNRVAGVKALAKLLKEDPVFENYEIIIAAGDGKSFEEESDDFKANEKSFDRVKAAIKNHDRTITLSCGQLTTGVTIKEWSAVLMLTDIKSPSLYMQAAFRAQNPYERATTDDNGQTIVQRKKSAYLFDFAPTRVLRLYDSFANQLVPKAARGEITQEERQANIRELLNFFPVISEDRHGKMVELDAKQVLTFPNAIAAVEVVKARFMSNLLFNDTIKNVFNLPRQAEDILNKMDVEDNKRTVKSSTDLDLDHTRRIEANKEKKITDNIAISLGEKIYANNIDEVVDKLAYVAEPTKQIEMLNDTAKHCAEPVISKLKEQYHLTNDKTNEIRQKIHDKQAQIAAEYVNKDIQQRNPEQLKQDLKKAIEVDLAQDVVTDQENKIVEDECRSKEEMIKDHLRAFTRTIPMCIMANHTSQEITIDNFDQVITDEDFQDLTNITKAEFAQLRDGFSYIDDNGEPRRFEGFFDKYCFNAAIAEFVAEKNKLGKYWLADQRDIFELIPNQKNNQIFTPRPIVQMMMGDLERERPELFRSTHSTFIDLHMKSGLYITEIVKRLFKNTRHYYDSDEAAITWILENQVYGLAPTNILLNITKSLIFGNTTDISTHHFRQYDLLEDAKNNTATQALNKLFNQPGDPMLKFDAVVGNPPYQVTVSESGRNQHDMPVYHYFYNSAFQVGTVSTLITPARFLTNAGYTPKAWNKEMLNDPHNKIMYHNMQSKAIFVNTDIKGGIVVLMHDNARNIGPIGLFTADQTLTNIARKVKSTIDAQAGRSMRDMMYGETKMNLDIVYRDFPNYQSIRPQSHIRDASLGTDALIIFPEMLVENEDSEHTLAIYGLVKNKRQTRYINPKYIQETPTSTKFGRWKVLVPKANGSGAIGETISTPVIGTPVMGHTMSFRSIGAFDTRDEAENLLRYIKTKFCRTMIGVLKTTQDMPPRVFTFVPIQNFTDNSDIDWSQSIPDIDQQLYRKYGLTNEEIDFIETHVKPME